MRLVSLMLVVTGLLMALDAPRTLGLYLLLLASVEGLVLTAWSSLLALQWWQAWCHRHRRRHRLRRPWALVGTRAVATLALKQQGEGVLMTRSEVDWRVFEGVGLCLLLLWLGVRT